MEWMILPLRRYAQFSGRSQRKEYWMFFLLIIVGSFLFSTLDAILGLGGSASSYSVHGSGNYAVGSHLNGGLLNAIFTLAILIPSLAVGARRLHDTDRSGWWLLLNLIPLIGFIILLVWLCTDGTPGTNRFGPNPKADLGNLQDTFR